jgi:hypothetical protein
MNKKHLRKISLGLILALLTPLTAPLFQARAANLSNAMIRLDRMTASQAGVRALVVFNPASTASEDVIRINFAAGFNVTAVTANVTNITNETVNGVAVAAVPGLGSVTINSQQVDIVISGVTAPGTLYGVYVAGIGTPAAGQHTHTVTTRASAADVDTAKVATRLIASDQVAITGTVPPTFNFTLSANSAVFATDLDPAAIVSTPGIVVHAETNAANGWSSWLRSANAGLTSVASGETIVTRGTVNGTTETIDPSDVNDYYQLDVSNPTAGANGTGGVPTVLGEYDGDGTHGGTFSTTFQEIAYQGTGTTDGDEVTLIARAVPTAIRAAATDYADTWTVVGAANF